MDAAVGDPPRLWARIGHPVGWFGAAIAVADRRFNRGKRRVLSGALSLLAILCLFTLPAALVSAALADVPFGLVLEAALASTLLAHRSLHEHVAAVAGAPSLEAARAAVAHIVGRETAALDEPGVARAAIETLSESLSDGVVAPALFFALFGLPGIVAYKVVNTADSMIGHRTARFERFGKAAARLDDAFNLVPSRLTAVLVAIASPRVLPRLRQVAGDARAHVSPNAGWPEAAFAASLGIALGGPRRYGDRHVEGRWLNARGGVARLADIRRGLALSLRVGIVHVALYGAIALLALSR